MQVRDEMAVIFTLFNRMDSQDDLVKAVNAVGPDADAHAVLHEAGNLLLQSTTVEDLRKALMQRVGYVSACLSLPYGMAIVPGTENVSRADATLEQTQAVSEDRHILTLSSLARYLKCYRALKARANELLQA